jgi:adenosine deaminase
MTPLERLKACELHVHIGGCLYADDVLELGREVYHDIDWRLFVDSYAEVFGERPVPQRLFHDAMHGGDLGWQRFRRHYVYDALDGGDFGRFMAKMNFLSCVYRHWRNVLQRQEHVLHRITDRHRQEGVSYVEYRGMYTVATDDADGFFTFHLATALALQAASRDGLTARYIISLPRWAPLQQYAWVKQLLDEHPELLPTIVGIDFCHVEEGFPPEVVRDFFHHLEEDNRNHPERALDVVYHVGESYFDKSLESAVRWCHEAAEMGARRLGHAIALGLDPAIAVTRQAQAHETECVRERLDQIGYDLTYAYELQAYGIAIDRDALEQERDLLLRQPLDASVHRPYTPERLDGIRHRQDFVLDRLAELGTVIESCPTSNLRIGGVPSAAFHPVHRFIHSAVPLVIGADDPGIFDSPLAAEIDWVVAHASLDAQALAERLGDPYRFRLGTRRSAAGESPGH